MLNISALDNIEDTEMLQVGELKLKRMVRGGQMAFEQRTEGQGIGYENIRKGHSK
jgi:hypothetical protein